LKIALVRAANKEGNQMIVAYAIVLIPAVICCTVGAVELRSGTKLPRKLINLFPVVLALVVLGVFIAPNDRLLEAIGSSSHRIAPFMVLLSGIIGSSGAVISYSRKSSSILMALTGLMLAFLWFFFNQPRI
jgi:hypothetical protein